MSEPISLWAAILWAVASGLVGVGIGMCLMSLFCISRRAEDDAQIILKGLQKPTWIISKPYLSDLAKGKSAKENMK